MREMQNQMMILKCMRCKNYTLHSPCSCGGEAVTIRPAKFSLTDHYASYRRKAKETMRKEAGLV